MAFRFWRRMKVAPGVSLNLSKSGASLSFGPRGGTFTVGSRGARATAGIPGTGLFYTQQIRSDNSRPGRGRPQPATPRVAPQDRLDLGFFKRLVTPKSEEALVDGCRALLTGQDKEAAEHFRQAASLADGAFLAGFQALKLERIREAEQHFTAALRQHKELGRLLDKYGIGVTPSLAITEDITAHVGPDRRSALLALTEIYQHLERPGDALSCLEQLRKLEPGDPLVLLSYAELLMETRPGDAAICRRVVALSKDVENETPVHTALLYYKARALAGLELYDAARDTLTTALRRRKGRPESLRHALYYLRGDMYERLGRKSRARKDWQRIYASEPGYEDVAKRLGI